MVGPVIAGVVVVEEEEDELEDSDVVVDDGGADVEAPSRVSDGGGGCSMSWSSSSIAEPPRNMSRARAISKEGSSREPRDRGDR